MGLVFAAPYTPPNITVVRPWKGIRHTWTGWDGSVWDLSRPSGGVFLQPEGLEGLGMPDFINYTHSSPVVHGQQWDGWLTTGRKVYWNVGVYSDKGSNDWIALNRAFWKTFRPGKTGVWTVELPNGDTFSLTLRLAPGSGAAYDRDPVQHGWKAYGIELFPEQPFWEGKPIVQSWDSEDLIPFLGNEDIGPPFHVSPVATIGDAKVTNPGDVESYIQWTVTGETFTVTVGIGGENTVIPFAVPDGEKLLIDTDPRNLIAELSGVDVMNQLREFNYPALQPGEDIKLSLAMEGSGSVEARFTPYYLMGT